MIFTEDQLRALEKAKEEKEAHGEIETQHPGYLVLEELQMDMDKWVKEYNEERVHSGKYCYGKTPWQTFNARHITPN
ncbi:hypothetical protein RHOW815_000708 [Candidatus Rhabdochlamydia sp. W815]|nr:hypothetical protein RHOW815_000708 [Candidatus Rhabdochlamydia sp. W815]